MAGLIESAAIGVLGTVIGPAVSIINWIKDHFGDGESDQIKGTLYEVTEKIEDDTVTKTSTAATLQPQIAKWYVALRTFALVGLLSALVYVGIRIILSSSSAQNQAKYKNMLMDWLVAVCILFLLHYLMAFILDITSRITEIFNVTTISANGEDVFITEIRNKITGEDSYWTYFGYVVMYIALVCLTITFTFEYLKRVIFIAFLTMVAPLIALTYPIDKIKDGRAQAFSMWIREYIFNCLIQPVHLLLYTIFIESATSINEINPIYAIVALSFFRPAEKFFKKMFGFDKAETVNNMAAAAGGAMVMNMLNKIKPKPNKDEGKAGAGGTSSPSGVRTATRNGANASATTSNSGANMQGGSIPGGSTDSGESADNNTSGGASTRTTNQNSILNGFNAVRKSIKGADIIKSAGKRFTKGIGGLAAAAAAGTVAIGANVADGDLFENPGKALGEIGATAAAGYHVGSSWANRGVGALNNTKETFKKGYYGEEKYNNMKFDSEFYKSSGYIQIEQDSSVQKACKDMGISVKEATQEYLENGITDAKQIREALKNGLTGDEYKAYTEAGIGKAKKIRALKDKGYTPSQVADRVKLASNAPKSLNDFKAMMVGREMNGATGAAGPHGINTVTDSDAERIFRELVDFF